ncbi:hypothetical protein NEOLEDRAFT_1126831 [Neolentinus lepideus HHB14362 ss-1]|uniref:Uncharacterized protein n=1 Tax=Neolentinus lepideus HHB14362 ss-1 TaxID=1314782 RepID=A0A165VR08_9AGAM|nr:hypothetical protein NEOLEDRAFT_1126831 [Neolentinus lepideus HHB14362 ss-1]
MMALSWTSLSKHPSGVDRLRPALQTRLPATRGQVYHHARAFAARGPIADLLVQFLPNPYSQDTAGIPKRLPYYLRSVCLSDMPTMDGRSPTARLDLWCPLGSDVGCCTACTACAPSTIGKSNLECAGRILAAWAMSFWLLGKVGCLCLVICRYGVRHTKS